MRRERIDEFVRGEYPRVVAAVAFACGDRGAAEDAVQEALARAWLDGNGVENLAAWVTRAAMNQARSRGRRLGAERRAYERRARLGVAPPEDGLGGGEGDLLDALRRLPARQREVVALHYLLDLAVTDVATVLGVTTGTVKTQLHRARTSLRRSLTDPTEEADRARR